MTSAPHPRYVKTWLELVADDNPYAGYDPDDVVPYPGPPTVRLPRVDAPTNLIPRVLPPVPGRRRPLRARLTLAWRRFRASEGYDNLRDAYYGNVTPTVCVIAAVVVTLAVTNLVSGGQVAAQLTAWAVAGR